MTECRRHDLHAPRFHHSGVGTISAGADRRVDERQAGARLQARTRPAGAGRCHDLSADPPRHPAGARELSRHRQARGRDPAAAGVAERRGCRRDHVRRGRGRRHEFRGAGTSGGAARPGTPDAARPADPEMGHADQACRQGPGAAGRRQRASRHDAGAGSRPPDGRHDHPAGRLGAARRAGAGRAGSLLAAHARLPQGHSRAVAGSSRRAKPHRAGRAPRPADRVRAEAARESPRSGDRSGFDRFDSRDREAPGGHRTSSARRGDPAGSRHRARYRNLGRDRSGGRRGRARPSAVRHAGIAEADRRRARCGRTAWRTGRAWT